MASLAEFMVQDWLVFIVGQQNVQKGLLASFLEREFSFQCQVFENGQSIPQKKPAGNRSLLLIRDCSGDTADDILKYLDGFGDRLLTDPNIYLALINFSEEFEIEAELLKRGVRGVVNGNVAPTLLVRFVRAIITGELWFPRQLVSRCILASRGQIAADNQAEALPTISTLAISLSVREKEVLVEIGIGSTNDQIADHLCISQHTVKSHIYRIFRKINVPNRLQAALWASKYLA